MNMRRILPLVGVALGGVIAIKAASGVTHFQDLVSGAKAFAEGVVPQKTQDAGKPVDPNAPPLPPGLSPSSAPAPGSPAAIALASNQSHAPTPLACGPDAAALAKDAGLSPAELQILQSLEARRGQLDQREQDMDVQMQLLTAAESKLDAKLKAMAAMKGDIQGLLDEADQKKAAQLDDLVKVYSNMKPRDAAVRLAMLDDPVRTAIAAKMKDRALAAIMGQMAPADAKALTEKLAHRYESQALQDAKAAVAGAPAAGQAPAQPVQSAQNTATPPPAAQAGGQPAPSAAPAKPAKVAKAKPRKKAKTKALAANTPAKADAAAGAASPPAGAPPATTPAGGAAAPAKSG